MSRVEIRLAGEGQCRITHEESGASIRSSKSPALGGVGGAFSSTDLLAAALGSCIATNLEPVAERHGVPLEGISVAVEKSLSVSPTSIQALAVTIRIAVAVDVSVLQRLERAAGHCLVHRSLSKEVDVRIDLLSSEAPT